jgi:lipoprotein-releasing system transmembrane protein lolC
VRMEKNMMSLLISLIIVVAISNIVTSLSLMVVDKQGEIAILQTQGLQKSQVRSIFIYQGLLVGVFGTLFGAILGILTVLNLESILMAINPNGVFLPTKLDFWQIAIVVIFSLFLSLLSTIYPAYRAAQTEPADALRYE